MEMSYMKKRDRILRVLVGIMMLLSILSIISFLPGNVAGKMAAGEVIIKVDELKKYGYPDDWVTFTISLKNSNVADKALVNLTLDPIYPPSTDEWNWTLSEQYNIILNPNFETDVSLDVRVESKPGIESEAGEKEHIKIYGEVRDFATNEIVDSSLYKSVSVEVLQEHDFEFENKFGEPISKTPNDAGQIQFNFTINNTGNGEDTFTFEIQGAPGTPFMPTTSVAPYSTKDHTLWINNIGKDIEAGDHFVTVKAYSENSSLAERSAGINVHINSEYKLDLSTGELIIKDVDPGSFVYYNFTIKNKGNDEDEIEIDAAFVGTSPWWEVDIAYPPSPHSIARNDSSEIQLVVSSPANETYPKTAQAFLNVSSTNDPTVYQYIDTIKAKIRQVNNVDIVSPSQRTLNETTQTASFPIDVYNEGNGEDTFEFEFWGNFPAGELWNYDFEPPSITLGPEGMGNDHGVVYFNVTGPEDAEYGSFKLKLNATSEEDPSVMDQKEITISVGKTYNVDITRLASEKHAAFPGDKISIQVRGENTGNFMDTFNLDVDIPTGAEDWTTDFDPDLYLDLAPSGIDYSWFNLTVDENAPQGFYIFTIKCNPSKDPSNEDTFLLNISVKKKYEVELIVSPTTKTTDPGVSSDFLFTVQNKGTGSCNVTMNATMLETYESYMGVDITPSSFELVTSTDTQMVWVNVTPSAGNPLAPMNDTTGIPITINADIGEKDGWQDAGKTVKIKINQTYGVDVYAESLYLTIEPGKSKSFNVTITNKGNGEDSFGLSAIVSGHPKWEISLSKSNTADLQQDEQEKILITVAIPETEQSVNDNITINVTARGDVTKMTYKIEKVEVQIKAPDRGVTITSPDNFKEGRPGTTINFTLTIRNTGTDNDFYNLEVLTTDPANVANWINPPDPWQTNSLEPDTLDTLFLDVKIPSGEDPSPPYATIEIQASSDKSPDEKDTITLSVEVEQVFKLKVEPVQNTVSIDPGENGTVTVDIRNQGTGTDDVEVETDWDSSNINYIDINEPTFTVNKNGVKKLTLTIGIVDEPDANDQSITVTITATSTKDTETSPAEHSDTITVEIVMIKLEVKTTDDTEDVTPNLSGDKATVEYDIQIWNKGLEADSFTIESSKINHAQYVKLSSENTPSVSPDSSATITVTIEIDNRKTKTSATDPSYPHLLTRITATSNKDDTKSEYIELTTRIKQAYGVELSVPDDTVETGETFTGNNRVVTYDIDVKNIGTGIDDFELEISGENKDWGSLSRSSVDSVDKDDTETVTLTVKIPKDESQGDVPLTVRAVSRGDDSLFDDTEDEYDDLLLTTKVTQYYDVHIPSPTTTYTALPGETISYPDFTVKNRGNGQDDVRVETEGSEDLDWSPKIVDKTLGKAGAADSSATVIITTTIPTDMRAGTYFINISLQSDTPTGYIDHVDLLTFVIKVDQVYDIDVSTEDASKDADPGRTLIYKMKIKNRGNGRDTFDLSVTGTKADWIEFEDGEDSITLEPDDSTIIDVIVTIPSLSSVSDLEDIEAGSYKVTVKAVSDGDDEVDDTLQLTITVKAVYEIQFEHTTTATQEDPIEADANDADGEKFNFIVKNNGNSDDTITMGTTSVPEYWIVSFNFQSFTLSPDETKEIIATIKFQDDVKSSTGKDFLITARSSDGDKFEDDNKVYVDVKQYNLKILEVTTSAKPDAGEKVTITATIKNEGTGIAEDVEVKFFDGSKLLGSVKIEEIEPGDEENAQYDWKVTEGDHKIKAEVEKDPTGKKESEEMSAFTAETDLIPADMFPWIIIIVAIIVLIVGLILGMSQRYRGVPSYLRDEINEVKKEIASGKTPEDIQAEREMKRGKGPAPPLKKDEGPVDKEAEGKEGKKGGKVVKIKCPKCDKIQTVTTTKRPLEFGCDGCGMKLVLKK
jgi:uncharacterized membrane protein